MTPIQFVGFLVLIVISLIAVAWNDIRITRLTSEVRRRFRYAAAAAIRLESAQSQQRIRSAELERGHHRTNSTVAEIERKVVGLEGRELRRIFAERLADGTFKHARPKPVRKRDSMPKRRSR